MKYLIKHGRASWHQQKAGHHYSGSIVVEKTPEELATFLAKIGEPYHITPLPAPPITSELVEHEDAPQPFYWDYAD